MDDKHGEALQYDPKWEGPTKERSCTDWICLIIFIAFIGGWAGIGYYAYTYGDVTTLLAPTDSEGRKCGIDSDVTDRPYLVFFDLTKCINRSVTTSGCDTPQLCVNSCPTDNFVWDENIITSNLTTLKSQMICKIGVNLDDAVSADELALYVDSNVCARWYLNSSSWTGRCIPNTVPEVFINLTMTTDELSVAKDYIQSLIEVEEMITDIYDDFIATRWTILVMLCCGIVVCLIYMVAIRWLAAFLFVFSIVAVCALFAYMIYHFASLYATDRSTFSLVLLIISCLALGIILFVSIFLRKRIVLACQLIRETSKAVISTASTLIFPILPLTLQILVTAYALVIAVYLLTLRVQTYAVELGGCECPENLGYTNGSACLPEVFNSSCTENNSTCITGGCYLSSRSSPWFSIYMQIFNIVGFVWLIFFLSALGEMVLAGTFATWYWTSKKSDVPFFTLAISFWRAIRYHIGTLAVGSFLITICSVIQWTLEYIEAKLKARSNGFVRFLLKCMQIYFWVLDEFLKFISKNAYIMCSIHGTSFFPSAKDAFNLLMRNIVKVLVLDKITEWLFFLGELLVTGIVAWLSWLYFKNQFPLINYLVVPVCLVVIGTYLVASVFFSVYAMAVHTVFHCFLEDCERNDGTPDKPYYMSEGLMRILRKS